MASAADATVDRRQLFRALAARRRLYMAELGKLEFAFRALGDTNTANTLRIEMDMLSMGADLADVQAGPKS